MHLATGIIALPLEVVEDIIVFLAIEGQFTTISSLAQTCRHLRQFIYDPADKHLWHRIFLTTFDDPSPLINANGVQGECLTTCLSLRSVEILSCQEFIDISIGVKRQDDVFKHLYG